MIVIASTIVVLVLTSLWGWAVFGHVSESLAIVTSGVIRSVVVRAIVVAVVTRASHCRLQLLNLLGLSDDGWIWDLLCRHSRSYQWDGWLRDVVCYLTGSDDVGLEWDVLGVAHHCVLQSRSQGIVEEAGQVDRIEGWDALRCRLSEAVDELLDGFFLLHIHGLEVLQHSRG